MSERDAMTRALTLAERGWGRVEPNPMVGAVLLKDGVVVSEGWHQEFGGPHAEAAALAAAGGAARGATCVVTLEPCAHHGKTPPCADALIAAGVTRVVAAVRDPDPAVRGGLERLRAAGIAVEHGLLAEEAAALNAPFLCGHARPGRPWVAVKVATSADGFLAPLDRRPTAISSREAFRWVHILRAGFDAIGVGKVTAISDDPLLTVRADILPRNPPDRLVFTRIGGLPPHLRLFHTVDAPTIVVTTKAGARGVDRDTIVGEDLPEMLRALREYGIRRLLIEGGARLIQSFLGHDMVDRCYSIRSPNALGEGIPAFAGIKPWTEPGWRETGRRMLGPDSLWVMDRGLCLPAS